MRLSGALSPNWEVKSIAPDGGLIINSGHYRDMNIEISYKAGSVSLFGISAE